MTWGMLSTASAQEIKVWKTVPVGIYQNTDEIRDAYHFRSWPVDFNAGVDSILSQGPIAFAATPATVNLVMVCAEDFGFRHDVSYEDLCNAARARGLIPCSAEVVLQLRLVYDDQPRKDEQYVAMNPIVYNDGALPGAKSILLLSNKDPYMNSILAIAPFEKMIPCQRQFIFQLQ